MYSTLTCPTDWILTALYKNYIFLFLVFYEIPRLLSLLVLACIASKDERDIPSKFGVSTPAFLYI